MIDLFKPLPNVKELNKNLGNYIKSSSESGKNVIRGWFEGFIDRDNKFVYEFQTSFESMLWELYCFAMLKEMKCEVDFSYNRPDFVVKSPHRFLIECTVVREENGKPKESDFKEKCKPSQDLAARTDYATVRMLNSINTKLKKYKEGYCTLEHVAGLPYIVAVTPFEQARFQDTGMEAIRKILWAETVRKVNGNYITEDFKKIKKRDNLYLDMGIFLNDSYKEISGVLFSNLATVSKPDCIASVPNMIILNERFNPHSQKANVTINYTSTHKTEKDIMRLAFEYRNQTERIINSNYSDRFQINKSIRHGYSETLTDGLHLFINPFAKIPLSRDTINLFHNNGICIHTYDLVNMFERPDMLIDNHLIRREKLQINF